ncbi:MAG: flagellar FliJ family protein [Candidatus Hydrogenedentota bacterium]
MKAKRQTKRFQDLCELRRRQENLKAQVYATALRQVNTAESERGNLQRTQIAMLSSAAVAKGEVINLDQQRSRYRYERYLATRIVEQDAVIHELKEVAEGSRVDMHESAKLRKMMETLAEKSQVSVDHEVKRQERLAMDETASMRAAASRASVKKG